MASSTAISSAVGQEPLLGDSKPITKPPKQEFILRPMIFSDIPIIAEQKRLCYWLSPINRFLTPRAPEHPEQLTRNFAQNIRRLYCNPHMISIVACPKDSPNFPIGHLQSARLGDDQGAKQCVKDKGYIRLLWMYILSWIIWAYDKVDMWVFPDTISDIENVKMFSSWVQQDREKYWEPSKYPERKNRWNAISLVVSPDFQGKGVGRLLMGVVLDKAQKERVPCGLTSSPHGEFLYRKLGFEYLGDYSNRVGEEKDAGGGIMCWWPEGWEGKTG